MIFIILLRCIHISEYVLTITSFLDPKEVTQTFLRVNKGISVMVIEGREADGSKQRDSSHEVFMFLYIWGCIHVEPANVIYVVLLEIIFP